MDPPVHLILIMDQQNNLEDLRIMLTDPPRFALMLDQIICNDGDLISQLATVDSDLMELRLILIEWADFTTALNMTQYVRSLPMVDHVTVFVVLSEAEEDQWRFFAPDEEGYFNQVNDLRNAGADHVIRAFPRVLVVEFILGMVDI